MGNGSGHWGFWAMAAILGIGVLGTFFSAIHNGFVEYDDPLYVTANPHVQQGFTWSSLSWAFSTGQGGSWHPLTWLSHMTDCELFGVAAWGHHLVNVLVHSLSTMILFAALRRMTCMPWGSFLAAAIFGVHPLRVESVAWVAERKDVLSTLFWMLALWCYACYAQPGAETSDAPPSSEKAASGQPPPTDRSKPNTTGRFYLLSLVCFAAGLMSKPMVVTLPAVLWLLDYWPLRRFASRQRGRLILEKIPFILLSGVASVVTFLVQKQAGALAVSESFWDRLANALISYCRYLGKLLCPTDLAAFYPLRQWPPGIVFGALALLIGITLLSLFLRKKRPWLIVGWLWFLGTLVPVIGLVQAGEQALADRYSYIPSVGVLIILVWELFAWTGTLQTGAGFPTFAASIGGIFLLFCVVLDQRQVGYWHDTERLFRHAIKVTGSNYLAHNNLGAALERRGEYEQAEREFRQATEENPSNAEAQNNLGVALSRKGRWEEALAHYQKASQLRPGYAEPHKNIGMLLEQLGKLDEAIAEYRNACRLQPDLADAHLNLGTALGRKGQLPEAIAEFELVLTLQPNSADAHNNLGVALEKQGRAEDAVKHFLAGLQLNPGDAKAHFNLGGALSRKGDLDGAIEQFRAALMLKPDYPAAQTNLALLMKMKSEEAGPRR